MHTDQVTELLREVAADVIMPRFGQLAPDEIDTKNPGDLVTIADKEAEIVIAARLAAAYPSAVIVGEEAAFAQPDVVERLPGAEHAWVIDPVDGTNNFARGSDLFGVMLAELRGGETVRAWIFQPVNGQMFVAERGAGVWQNGSRVPPRAGTSIPPRGYVPCRYRRQPVPGFDLLHTSGACAVDYPRLVTGDIDLIVYHHWRAWDHAAGSLMVTEVGGHVAMHPGVPWRVGMAGSALVVASSREVWHAADVAFVTPVAQRVGM